MIKKILLFSIVLIFTLGWKNAKATYTITTPTSEQYYYQGNPVTDITLCTEYTVIYKVYTTSAPGSDILTIQLPYGITYTGVVLPLTVGVHVTHTGGTATAPAFTLTGWTGHELDIEISVITPSCPTGWTTPLTTTVSGALSNTYTILSSITPETPNLEVTSWIHTSSMATNVFVSGASPINVIPGESGEIVFALQNTGLGGIEDINLMYDTTTVTPKNVR